MTDALFLNTKIRSSHPVAVNLADAGIEINHPTTEFIAMWPYEAVSRNLDEPPKTHQFYLGRHYATLLQVDDVATAQQIIARSPLAQGSRMRRILKVINGIAMAEAGRRLKMLRWQLPLVALLLLGSALWQARHWFLDIWRSVVGG